MGSSLFSQVAIEKEFTGNPSVILEFNDTRDAAKTSGNPLDVTAIGGDNKTLILPIVSTIASGTEQGTIWFDAADDIIKYQSATGAVAMTSPGTDVMSPLTIDNTLTDQNGGTIIGAQSSTAPGVLVLESSDKAMVLPVVNGVLSVTDPEAGSIVYDKVEKAIAVYTGKEWFFWGNY